MGHHLVKNSRHLRLSEELFENIIYRKYRGWKIFLIRFLKQCLRRVLRQARVNYQELLTLLKEFENILSNRPLTVVYYDKLINVQLQINYCTDEISTQNY